MRNQKGKNQRLDLSAADLRGANLIGAHLEGVRLMKTHLERADLSEAHLEGARLSEAHFEGDKNLTQEQIDSAFGDENTTLPEGLTAR